MMKEALAINKASIGYRTGKKTIHVVDGIDASLHCGELVALIGKNGAGKSTLLRTLSALQEPLSGDIELNGKNITGLSPNDVAKELSLVLTSIEQASLTVRELVSLGRTPYTDFLGRMTAKDNCIVDAAMDVMGVGVFEERMLSTLSDGERQKCMIAKALAQETPLILLDEPTAFLDFGSKVTLFRTLKKLAKEKQKAILVSTHDVELAIKFADRIWLLSDGMLEEGVADELFGSGALQRVVECDGVVYDSENKRIEITQI